MFSNKLVDEMPKTQNSLPNLPPIEVYPVGKHPILAGTDRFRLATEEHYKGMWQSPKITPLLLSDTSTSDKTVAWIGPHPKARVVSNIPGHSAETLRDPNFRRIVHNSLLWSARRLG
jgi:type 1 glutamine amidotransferase